MSNLTGTWITPQQATSPAYYADHLRRAVQFEAGMRTLAADAALLFVEVGPGAALTSLARMNLGPDGGRRVVASMRRPTDARNDDEAMLEAAGRLWLAGSTLDWSAVHAERRRRRGSALPPPPPPPCCAGQGGQWYYSRGGAVHGPVSDRDLKRLVEEVG